MLRNSFIFRTQSILIKYILCYTSLRTYHDIFNKVNIIARYIPLVKQRDSVATPNT